MSLFQKKPDPFSDELKQLEEQSRRVEEESRRVQETMRRMGEPVPETDKMIDPEQFKGAMFKDGDQFGRQLPPTRKALKVQKRKMRNRVIVLGVVLLILVILVLRTLA